MDMISSIFSVCKEQPELTAVNDCQGAISYGVLGANVAQLTDQLIEKGIGKGDVVAIYDQRRLDVIVALISIMNAGAAYTIVEVSDNPTRDLARLADLQADLVVSPTAYREMLLHADLSRTDLAREDRTCKALASLGFDVDRHASVERCTHLVRPVTLEPDDVAYVLYTSGSSGKPKGVEVTHGNCQHYVAGLFERLSLRSGLSYVHVSSLAADLGNTSILASLSSGGNLHIISDEVKLNAALFADYIKTAQIDVVKVTPGHWRSLSSSLSAFQSLQIPYLILGGETLTLEFAREILTAGHCQTLINHYGPTEATVGVSACVIRQLADLEQFAGDSVPIGKPMGETVMLVKDSQGQLHTTDAEGELFIGGPAVAKGYRDEPERTAQSFVTDLAVAGRFYRTGDVCVIDSHGYLTFKGRRDLQVKISGFRIELPHVETVLNAQLTDISAVSVHGITLKKNKKLVAALLQPGLATEIELAGVTQIAAMREQLADHLPDHMVPSLVVNMQAFPLNANGKVDRKALEQRIISALAQTDDSDLLADDSSENQLTQDIRLAWRNHLELGQFGNDDSFFEAGGNSIDAIQVISELQVKGYHITTHAFLKQPTVNGIAEIIQQQQADSDQTGVHTASHSLKNDSDTFVSSQQWFLQQDFVEPNYWNQALVLTSERAIDVAAFSTALAQVIASHPMLGAAFTASENGWSAACQSINPENVFSVATIAANEAFESYLTDTATRLNQRINLSAGELFFVHLAQKPDGETRILFICHHLVIDGVSWRVLLDDLLFVYKMTLDNTSVTLPQNRQSFWDWGQHVTEHYSELDQDLAYWHHLPAADTCYQLPVNDEQPNLEADAESVWFSVSPELSHFLENDLCRRLSVAPQSLFLALWAAAIAEQGEVAVDIEGHGRVLFDESMDLSRVVGWFTSMFPLAFSVSDNLEQVISQVDELLERIPNQGIAYGELIPDASKTRPQICFNFLGNFYLGKAQELGIDFAREYVGPMRGASNARVHDIKLTVRHMFGQFVMDMSYSDKRLAANEVERITLTFQRLLDQLAPHFVTQSANSGDRLTSLTQRGSSTGLLTYAPAGLQTGRSTRAALQQRPTYQRILLTGATGFLGAYMLRDLLAETAARIVCLVREKAGHDGKDRLLANYRYYFPDDDLQAFNQRVEVIIGDVSQPEFGLSTALYDELSRTLDAVYHFAADIRLFSDVEQTEQQVLTPVKTLIALAGSYQQTCIHYMSTLAVCGINESPNVMRFNEKSLDIAQDFQNAYERYKFDAEVLLREYHAKGGRVWIYRSGNVSADSQTGRFQRNAGDNRFVQFLQGVVKNGVLPADMAHRIVLSPVDIVTKGIVALSLAGDSTQLTYHVDSMYPVSYQSIFACFEQQGFAFETGEGSTFEPLLRDNHQDPAVCIALFWSRRKPRNVEYDNTLTLNLMQDLGVEFPVPSQAWLQQFVSDLTEHAFLQPAAALKPATPTQQTMAHKPLKQG